MLEGTVDIYRIGQQRRLQSGKVMCHKLPAVDQLRAIHLEWEDKRRHRHGRITATERRGYWPGQGQRSERTNHPCNKLLSDMLDAGEVSDKGPKRPST